MLYLDPLYHAVSGQLVQVRSTSFSNLLKPLTTTHRSLASTTDVGSDDRPILQVDVYEEEITPQDEEVRELIFMKAGIRC